jgi:YggT family protein
VDLLLLIIVRALDLFSLLVLVAVLVRFFIMNPNHPVRQALDSIVEPLLMPIRRMLPPTAGFDLSPLVLILLIRVATIILTSL